MKKAIKKVKEAIKVVFKSAPVKMRSLSEVKKGDLHISSIKMFAGGKEVVNTVKVPKAELAKAKNLAKDNIAGFKEMMYKYCYDLKVTSRFVKTNECQHPRELSHCLRHITKAINRPDLCKQAGQYGKKGADKVKAVKATNKVKASKAVAKVKAKRSKKAVKVTVKS